MLFQCERLEEHCHESFLVTVSSAGHLVMGSAKGRQFLEEKMGLIEDFINFCMSKECCYLDRQYTCNSDMFIPSLHGSVH